MSISPVGHQSQVITGHPLVAASDQEVSPRHLTGTPDMGTCSFLAESNLGWGRGKTLSWCLPVCTVSGKYCSQPIDMCYIRSQPLRSKLTRKYTSFTVRVGIFQSALSVVSPEVGESMNPLRAVPQITIVLWISWTQAHWFSELNILKTDLLAGSLKHYSTTYDPDHSLSGGGWELWIFSHLCVTVPQIGLWQEFCQPLLPIMMLFFLIHLMCRNCSVRFWISFRGNCFTCHCRFSVCMGVGEFRNILFCHLDLELLFFMLLGMG